MRTRVHIHDDLPIGVRPTAPATARTIGARSPAAGRTVGSVAEADSDDTHAPVAADRVQAVRGRSVSMRHADPVVFTCREGRE